MARIVPFGIAILLTACGAAMTGNDTATSAPQRNAPRAAPQSAGDGWSGNYRGQFDGGRGTVEISSLGRSSYLVELSTIGQGTGCSGGANGTGVVQGNRMTMEMPLQFSPGMCRITLDRNGATLAVSEDNCLELHGAQCSFEGSVARIGGTAAQTVPRRAVVSAEPPWIVGAWVSTDNPDCDGEGWVINADGTYADTLGSGRWTLNGNTLTSTMLQQVSGDDEIPVRPPRVFRAQILRHDLGSFSVRFANGSVGHLVRCR
jgi:hypothetical protein